MAFCAFYCGLQNFFTIPIINPPNEVHDIYSRVQKNYNYGVITNRRFTQE